MLLSLILFLLATALLQVFLQCFANDVLEKLIDELDVAWHFGRSEVFLAEPAGLPAVPDV
jgi:hypothetical protein